MLKLYANLTLKNSINLPQDITNLYYFKKKIFIVSKLGNIYKCEKCKIKNKKKIKK